MSEQPVALAQNDELGQQQNREPLARLNAAYADELTAEEQTLLRKFQESYARLLEDKW